MEARLDWTSGTPESMADNGSPSRTGAPRALAGGYPGVDGVGPAVDPNRDEGAAAAAARGSSSRPRVHLTNSHSCSAPADSRHLRRRRGFSRSRGDDPDTALAVVRVEVNLVSAARRLATHPGRPAGGRDRQSVRFSVHGHGRRRQRARTVASFPIGTAHRGRHPDRRGAQSRQLRWSAGRFARRGDRRQYGRHSPGAGHLLRDGDQHGQIRRRAFDPRRSHAAEPDRHRRPDRRPAAPRRALPPALRRERRVGRVDRAREPGGRIRAPAEHVIVAYDQHAIGSIDDLQRPSPTSASASRRS